MEIFGNHLLASNPTSCLLSSCNTSGCSQESFGACSATSSSGSQSIFAAAEDSSSQEESGIKISVCTEIQGATLLQECAKEGTGQRAGLRAHLQGSTSVQGHTCRGARGDLSAGSAEFWLCLAKGVQVAGRAMSSSESGPQPCLLAPALPSKAQRLGKSGTSIYGFSAAAEEPAARERNTAVLELHLQKQLLWSFLFFFPLS